MVGAHYFLSHLNLFLLIQLCALDLVLKETLWEESLLDFLAPQRLSLGAHLVEQNDLYFD